MMLKSSLFERSAPSDPLLEHIMCTHILALQPPSFLPSFRPSLSQFLAVGPKASTTKYPFARKEKKLDTKSALYA